MSILTSLTSYWKFDESSGNASDATATANTLANNNTAVFSSGKINNGVTLVAASSQDFTKTDNASLSITGDLSFSCWVKMVSQPALNSVMNIMSKWNTTSNQRSYQFNYQDASGVKKLEYRYSADGGATNWTIFQCNQTLTNGTWYFLTVTVTGSTVIIYVNGASVSGTTVSSSASSSFDSIAIFAIGSLTSASQYLDGMIDEVGLWARVLTPTEVSSLYFGGAGLAYPLTPIFPLTDTSVTTDSVTVAFGFVPTTLTDISVTTDKVLMRIGMNNRSKHSSTFTNRQKS